MRQVCTILILSLSKDDFTKYCPAHLLRQAQDEDGRVAQACEGELAP